MAENPGSAYRPDACLTAALHHLGLQTSDPARLAQFYEEALGYRFEEKGSAYIGRGPDRRLILSEGPSKTLSYVGFALPDAPALNRLRGRLSAAGISRADEGTVLFEDAVTVADPDGNLIGFGIPRTDPKLVSTAQDLPARLQHLVVASQNPGKIIDFYADVLGFTLSDNVVDDEGGLRTSFLRCSNDHHSFAVFKAAENRLDHHCYETTDWNSIRDWCDRMAAAHIPIQWGPGRHGPGNNLFVFIHDPDGNWLEISAELEQVAHDRPVGAWPHEQRTLNSWGQGLLRS